LNNILVTGATGFVGAHLLFELTKKEQQVVALRRSTSSLKQVEKIFSYYTEDVEKYMSRIIWREADVLNYNSLKEAMQGITQVYHCAAIVSFNPDRKADVVEMNTLAAANIVRACLEQPVNFLCHMSSIAALGSSENSAAMDENSKWSSYKNKSGYALGKYFAEMQIWQGIERGLNAVIVNPSVILGPGDWKAGSPKFFDFTYGGNPFYTVGAKGFVCVTDVVKAMIELSQNKETYGQRFLLSSENFTFRDLFSMIANALGKKAPSIKATPFLMNIACAFEMLRFRLTGREASITAESVESGSKTSYFNGEKVKQFIDFNYTPIKDCVEFAAKCYLSDKGES
jgi:nucleoside-diphosphate-sugar epimerase